VIVNNSLKADCEEKSGNFGQPVVGRIGSGPEATAIVCEPSSSVYDDNIIHI